MKGQDTGVRSIHHPYAKPVMPRRRRLKWGLVLFIGAAMLTRGARAQTTNVYDGVTVELTNDLYVGYTNSYNQLEVINGATLSDTNSHSVYVGYSTNANGNSVLVSGSESVWNQLPLGSLFVGYAGSGNSLTVSSGAKMDVHELDCGYYGSENSLTLSGGGVINYHGSNGQVGFQPGSDNNRMVVTGSGTLWTNGNGSGLIIGSSDNGNSLVISDGAVVSALGTVGREATGGYYASNNSVVITGSGSIWTNSVPVGEAFKIGSPGEFNMGNSLIVTNGGSFVSPDGVTIGGIGNYVCVTGSGSVADFGKPTFNLGYSTGSGGGNTLVISNGGWASSYQVYIGTGNLPNGTAYTSDHNQVVVSGSGSVWTNSYQMNVGDTGSENSLFISDGGRVVTPNLIVGANRTTYVNFTPAACSNNVLTVSSGILIVTNSARNGKLAVGAAGAGTNSLVLNAGSVTANMLEVYSNSIVTGCGTINGTVVIDRGGTVQASCGGSLNFTGNVTNNGTMRAINGSVLSVSGVMENNGVIDVINGAANFTGGFVNNGTFQTASSVLIGQASVSGQDVLIQIPSVVGHTYGLQYTTSLAPASWADTGPTQAGTGGVLTFTDPGVIGTGPDRFYHVVVTAP